MTQLFTNNATALLSADITAGATNVYVAAGKGALFASPTGGDFQLATLTDDNGQVEIVKVTSRATDTLAIVRAQEGTTAVPFLVADGARISSRLTKGTMELYPQFDTGGNAKGADAVNLQPSRSADTQVASGADAIAIGADTTASAAGAVAIGEGATAAIAGTAVINAAQMVQKDTGQTDFLREFTAPEIVIMSDEVELDVLADDVAVVTLPSGCKFFPSECGVIITVENTVTVDPAVEFGITGTTDHLLAAVTVTETAVGERTRYTTLLDYDGQTSLTFSVQTAATATDLKGRVYWKGILVESE